MIHRRRGFKKNRISSLVCSWAFFIGKCQIGIVNKTGGGSVLTSSIMFYSITDCGEQCSLTLLICGTISHYNIDWGEQYLLKSLIVRNNIPWYFWKCGTVSLEIIDSGEQYPMIFMIVWNSISWNHWLWGQCSLR